MAGSKTNALETFFLNVFGGPAAALPASLATFAGLRSWRIRHVISATDMEAGTGVVYSSAPAIAITQAQLTVSGNQISVNTQLDAASGISAGETITRRVLEVSLDGFSTILGAYYSSDVYDADDTVITGVAVPTGTILRVPANSGFVATED